jgi:hypothetical protein
MGDPFQFHTDGLTAPWQRQFKITPSNANPLPTRPRAIRANTAGVAVLEDIDGTVIAWNVEDGDWISGRVVAVRESGDGGTTTAELIGVY